MRSAVQSCDPLQENDTADSPLRCFLLPARTKSVRIRLETMRAGSQWDTDRYGRCRQAWQATNLIPQEIQTMAFSWVSKIIMLTTSVEAICLNYRPKKDNTYPLVLRLTKSGKRKNVSLDLSVKEKDWDLKRTHLFIPEKWNGIGSLIICL